VSGSRLKVWHNHKTENRQIRCRVSTYPACAAGRASLPACSAAGPELQSADKVRVWFGDASLRWASYRSGDSTVSFGGPDKARSLHLKSPPPPPSCRDGKKLAWSRGLRHRRGVQTRSPGFVTARSGAFSSVRRPRPRPTRATRAEDGVHDC
jgi:hypothetical protein